MCFIVCQRLTRAIFSINRPFSFVLFYYSSNTTSEGKHPNYRHDAILINPSPSGHWDFVSGKAHLSAFPGVLSDPQANRSMVGPAMESVQDPQMCQNPEVVGDSGWHLCPLALPVLEPKGEQWSESGRAAAFESLELFLFMWPQAFLVECCHSQHSPKIWKPFGDQRHSQTSAKQSWGQLLAVQRVLTYTSI